MPRRRFSQVDVFGVSPLGGNPVAVVHEAGSLSVDRMGEFARWTSLSETTFLLPPSIDGGDYRVRIFTPDRELPFAGHPTLGSAHAWLSAGGEPQAPGTIVQECAAGLVSVRSSETGLAFAAPPCVRSGPVDEATLATVASGLGTTRKRLISHQWADNGPGWLVVEVASITELMALSASPELLRGLDVGAFAMAGASSPYAYEVRAFVPGYTGCEDPVTGSLNASLAQWLRSTGRTPETFRVHQGTAVGRDGVVTIHDDGNEIWVGGSTTTIIDGSVEI